MCVLGNLDFFSARRYWLYQMEIKIQEIKIGGKLWLRLMKPKNCKQTVDGTNKPRYQESVEEEEKK